MTKTTMFMSAAAIAMMVSVAPAAAATVEMTPPDRVTVPTNDPQALRAAAEALFSQPKEWKKAGRMLEKSARLRDANDPEAFECLMMAARVRSALEDYKGAREILEKAAEHALARGEVLGAAHAYVDAAHMAVSEKQPERVKSLVSRAKLLTSSPLLTAEQRTSVTSRIAS